jgi:AraC-like DNA-binding protein
MEAHFADDINLCDVARAVGQHPSTLSKAFSGKTGIKFNFYLQYIRCSHAARMLQSSDVSITEAALSSGFGSIRSFNRAFKIIYDITPSQYRSKGIV